MKNLFLRIFPVLLVLILVQSCSKEEPSVLNSSAVLNLPTQKYDYSAADLPEDFSFRSNQPANNIMNDDGATLGRVLFYDKALSLNNKISCGSCHLQSAGFADISAQSIGFEGQKTPRNSIAIMNVGYTNAALFWDNRTASLEEQAIQPIKNHIEMGVEKMDDLVLKLARIDYYGDLFTNAFGSEEITADRISKALAQFMRSIVSYKSKYDNVMFNGASFSESEHRGASMFHDWERGCVSCHSDFLNLSGNGDVANIGLDEEYSDKGIAELSGHESQNGVFKVPSLRNIALTAPYMHDGRFETLEEVVEHYSTGIKSHPNLDWRLTDLGGIDFFAGSGEPRPFSFTEQEKADLVSFLHTLTDNSLVNDERFADPFVY